MIATVANSFKFRGHRCFKESFSGFNKIKPINVIIGRNNTGKSHLLDLVETATQKNLLGKGWSYLLKGRLDERSLRLVFQESVSGGELGGSHWRDHGKLFVDIDVEWQLDRGGNIADIVFPPGFPLESTLTQHSTAARLRGIKKILSNVSTPISGAIFRRLFADRDIRPEKSQTGLVLGFDGHGASNIVRRYILTSNSQYPRELIQNDLLKALNVVFGSDGEFAEIQIKEHDEPDAGRSKDHWEIYLGQTDKGLVPLSNSGSGLKTVLLVLLNLLVVPEIERQPKSNFVYAFEELENNLHPALLRRLFVFLEDYAIKEKISIFLTTHSSTALDIFGVSENAQIIHVAHNGQSASATTVDAHFDHLGVISELGAKPSDLLQSNGIIWVEGPSDCIYINRWLDLYTEGRLQEGRDYQCAFYGGSLLARTQFKTPIEAEAELVNLFRINPNIVVVCDGDRSAKGARVKDRVRRIRSEVRRIRGAHIWVTEAREIENYLTGDILGKALELSSLRDPDRYEAFFPRKGSPNSSYLETQINRRGIDKVDLASLSVPHIKKVSMETRFDWNLQMEQIVERIESWNK